MDFLSQGWWQGAGVIIGALVAFIIYKLQDKKKRLSYRIIYSQSLFSVDEQVKNDLIITYKGSLVNRLSVIEFQIINNGSIPVEKGDFEGEIVFVLDNCFSIFETKISEVHPTNLKIDFDKMDNKLFIRPLLINPKDYFKMRIVFDGSVKDYSFSARIKDVSAITSYAPNEHFSKKESQIIGFAIVGLIGLIGTMFITLAVGGAAEINFNLNGTLVSVIFGSTLVGFLYYMFKNTRF